MTKGTTEQTRRFGEISTPAPRSSPTLRGRWLLLIRVAWVAAAVAALGQFVLGIPARYSQLTHPVPGVRAALTQMGLSPAAYALYNVALDAAFVSVFAAVAIVIFWRRSNDPVALLVATMLVVWGPLNELVVLTPGAAKGLMSPLLELALYRVPVFIGYVAWMLFFYLFPSGRFVPLWTRWLALCWLLFLLSWNFTPFGPLSWPSPIFNVSILVLWASFPVAQLYRYARVSDAIQRQQTKWVVYGVAVAVAGFLATRFTVGVAGDFRPEEVGRWMLSMFLTDAFVLALPVSIGIAVLRSRLFDIDVVINRTLVYGSLTGALVAVYFGGVATLQALFRALTGQEQQPQLAVVASTLAIAALFNPLRGRIQSFIDRRFYRSKYDAAKTLESFSSRLREETDLGALADDLVGVVKETMQPAHVSLWLPLDHAPQRSGSNRELRD